MLLLKLLLACLYFTGDNLAALLLWANSEVGTKHCKNKKFMHMR
jgi:hypothetical protein